MDFTNRPTHGTVEIRVNVVQVLDDTNLVAISSEKRSNFLVVHAAKNGSLANLEPIDMQNREYSPRLCRVDVFNGMPRAVWISTDIES